MVRQPRGVLNPILKKECMDSNLIELARQFEFVALWWEWLMRYQDDASNPTPHALQSLLIGYGYRAGHFWSRGACREDSSEEWAYFFDTMADEHGLRSISIHALYCYEQYPSCRRFIDSGGTDYRFPH